VGGRVTIPVVVMLILGALYARKAKGAQVGAMVWGAMIGVQLTVGSTAHDVLLLFSQVLTDLVNAVTSAIGGGTIV
jgi:hypothetical protein